MGQSVIGELVAAGAIVSGDATSVDGLIAALGEAADPGAALLALGRIAATGAKLSELLADDDGRRRVVFVLGASSALGDLLVRHPDLLGELAPGAPGLDVPAAIVRDQLVNAALGAGAPAPDPQAAATATSPAEEAVGASPARETPAPATESESATVGPRAEHSPPKEFDAVAATAAMRLAYRRRLLQIAAADLTSDEPTAIVDQVAAALADLAGAALEASLAIARAANPEAANLVRLAVIGMGKCGGRELNYVSDVDVIYVAEPAQGVAEAQAMDAGARLATALAAACSSPGVEPALWPVDPNLRPEGKSGPLVRTLESHRDYLERWAHTWEFQALLKARPIAGDPGIGAAYAEMVAPYVWRAAERDHFVADAQAMRRRVLDHVPAAEATRQLKLGAGGLRDVEFTVQLLQLVHGRADESLRIATTLPALAALAAGGYVSRADAEELDACYRRMRTWEHRLQLSNLRRTHLMPSDPAGLQLLARAARLRPVGATDASPSATAEDMDKAWRRTRADVRRLHEELFYRPLLPETAKLSADEAVLEPGPARDRLAALGYRDPDGALRHLTALTSGVSRRAAIQRQLLPVMLGWFARGADPDAALLAFRDLSEKLGSTPWYLRLLRDSGTAAPRLAAVLSRSRFAAQGIARFPEAVAWLSDDEDLAPPARERLFTEARALARRAESPEAAIAALRAMRHREATRAAMAVVVGLGEFPQARRTLSHVSDAVLDAGLAAITRASSHREPQISYKPEDRLPIGRRSDGFVGDLRLAVVGLGSFGARDLGFGSDCDVVFVHDGGAEPDLAAREAVAAAGQLVTLFGQLGPQPPLILDADLRPEGKNGALSRSFDSLAEYYGRWSEMWERQALLRARPVAGSSDLGLAIVRLIDPLRYPQAGLGEAELREMRRMKARVEAERLPRGADPARHVKLGPGGMSDVEWLCQLLQLRHAGADPSLRIPAVADGGTRSGTAEAATTSSLEESADAEAFASGGTLDLLAALTAAGHLSAADADALAGAWSLAAAIRDANVLWRGRADAKTNEIPHDHTDLAGIAVLLGYRGDANQGAGAKLEEDYLRRSRLARAIFEREFYA